MTEQQRTIEDILAVASDPAYHRVATARITFVPQELREEHERLDALLPTLLSDTIDAHPERIATAERLAEIEAEFADSVIEFRFKAIGHRAWADLLRKHPPTKEQLRLDRTLDHNPETFPHEAMAASCVDPVMTPEQVKALEASEAIDVSAWAGLWNACIKANVVAKNPKSIAAGLIHRQSAESAPLPTTSESLAPSFSVAS